MIPLPGTRVRLTGSTWGEGMRKRTYEATSWGYDCVYIMFLGQEIKLENAERLCPQIGFAYVDPPNPTDTAR